MTIEERARYYQANVEERNPNAEAWDFETAYRHGATDQKEIDIDKACEEFLRFLNTRVDNPLYQLRKEDFPSWVKDFRQCLEE